MITSAEILVGALRIEVFWPIFGSQFLTKIFGWTLGTKRVNLPSLHQLWVPFGRWTFRNLMFLRRDGHFRAENEHNSSKVVEKVIQQENLRSWHINLDQIRHIWGQTGWYALKSKDEPEANFSVGKNCFPVKNQNESVKLYVIRSDAEISEGISKISTVRNFWGNRWVIGAVEAEGRGKRSWILSVANAESPPHCKICSPGTF